MNITLDPQQSSAPVDSTPAAAPVPREPRLPISTAPAPEPTASKPAVPVLESSQPSVTFRKDSSGRIYYVVTDPQSGKEIRQVPADAVRKAAEGLDQFLKQEQAKQGAHLEVKA